MNEGGPKKPSPSPDVSAKNKSEEYRERRKTLGLALLASLGALLYLYEPKPSQEPTPMPTATAPRAEPKEGGAEKMPATDEENVAQMHKTIVRYSGQFTNMQERQAIPMLQPNLDIGKVCKFTSDWMVEQSDNLFVLWEYLEKRKSSWPDTIRADLEHIRTLPPKILQPATIEAIESMISNRLSPEGRKPFKCGMGLMFVSDATKRTMQNLGAEIIAESLQMIAKDLVDKNPERVMEGQKVARVTIEAIRAAFVKSASQTP